MTRVLALDVGSTFVRAGIYDASGAPVSAHARLKHDGEKDADELLRAVDAVAAEARRGHGRVDAVAVSSFWHSLLALDARGRPLTPILGWRDVDAMEDAGALRGRVDPEAAYRRTGAPIHPSFWPAKLAWLARAQPDTFAAAARFVSFADYLRERATGESATSVSIASGTGLLDLRRRDWDEELCAAVRVDAARLPRISDEPAAGEEAWYPPLGDGACSNLGVGCVTRDRAALMIGTSGALRTVYDGEPSAPPQGLFQYLVDERRVVEGGALSDGGNLYFWLKETLRLPDEDVLAREPRDSGVTFLPLLGGERSPGWNAHATGAVAGLTFATTPEDLFRAALEGVALRFAEIADLLPHVREVVATGGAMAANEAWVQIVADVLERPVTLSAVEEASARGAAVHVLERLGLDPDAAPLGRTFEPRAERAEAYRSARERQRALYENAAPLWMLDTADEKGQDTK